jgi:hypothetical protein
MEKIKKGIYSLVDIERTNIMLEENSDMVNAKNTLFIYENSFGTIIHPVETSFYKKLVTFFGEKKVLTMIDEMFYDYFLSTQKEKLNEEMTAQLNKNMDIFSGYRVLLEEETNEYKIILPRLYNFTRKKIDQIYF